MPAANFLVYAGVYDRLEDALTDYDAVKKLHSEAGLIEDYDAAVIERREDGKVKVRKRHETPTRVGGVSGGAFGLATGLIVALFPAAAIGEGIVLATTGTGALIGAVAGHAAAGMSRKDLKEIGEQLDAGEAGLIVVAATKMQDRLQGSMTHARTVDARRMHADTDKLEAEAKETQVAVTTST